MALGLLALAMYISCIFHAVCASFSALATRKLADAKAVFSGIWALVLKGLYRALLKRINFDVFKREFPICDVARGLIGDPLILW